MADYKLVALDLDGTLFDDNSRISDGNLAALRRITDAGVHAVISTGRPFLGLPFDQLKGSGIDYAITANGSAIYRLSTGECLCEEAMDIAAVLPILDFLLTKDIHIVAFIEGKGYMPVQSVSAGEKLPLPAEIKYYVTKTRTPVEDLKGFIRENNKKIQKVTLNFYADENGNFTDREEVRVFLESNPAVSCVCGGYNNLEFTRADVNKGRGLCTLAHLLHIPEADTMAIGDSGNDIAILKAAGLGIAMGNASREVLAEASYITDTNGNDGVAAALMHFFPELF
ncbi:MAG: Cof-type HAD-IIB family hydrolase [Blautia sp.]|nr:Cof-type HAD-IIB family hydrolase [Blautia sp.]